MAYYELAEGAAGGVTGPPVSSMARSWGPCTWDQATTSLPQALEACFGQDQTACG